MTEGTEIESAEVERKPLTRDEKARVEFGIKRLGNQIKATEHEIKGLSIHKEKLDIDIHEKNLQLEGMKKQMAFYDEIMDKGAPMNQPSRE